jgi:outer membrane receptor for ferrienterochelin and colicins
MAKRVGLISTAVALSCLFVTTVGAAERESSAVEMQKTVVTATRTEHTLGDVPVAAEVITREEIKAKNIQTVQDAIKHLPGITIIQNSGSWGNKGNVQIQGLDAKQTLILVDGQKYYGGHGAVDLNSIPIEMVERIEVVKGPASALYGSDAIGGVVHIITKSGADKATFSGSTAFGTRSTRIHEAGGGFKKGKFKSLLNFTYKESDGRQADYTDSSGIRQSDHYDEYILMGSFDYNFTSESGLAIKPYYSENTVQSGLSATELQDRVQKRVGLNTIWNWRPDSLSKLNLRGSWFNYRHNTEDRSSDWEDDSYEAEIDYSRLVMTRHTITGGYHYHNEATDDAGKDYDADQTLHSFYLQDEMDFEPVIFVLAARLDEHDKWGAEINPKASLLYRVTDNFRLRASVGRAFKGPTLTNLYADGWRMGPYTVHANPDLKPETSLGYQLGTEYEFSERFCAKLSFFRNEVENLINSRTVRSGPPPWAMYWENISEARTQGAEASLIGRLMENLTGSLGYAFLDTENKETGKELVNRPKYRIDLGLDWKIPAIGMNLNLACQHIGERYDDEENTIKLDAYTIYNFSATQKMTRFGELFLRIDNIFGEKDIADEYDLDGAQFLAGVRINL